MAVALSSWESAFNQESLSSNRNLNIQYKDHNGYWAPLQCLYWASDTLKIVSNHSSSCFTESMSSYCPCCFEVTSKSDSQLACRHCYCCPVCSSMVVMVQDLEGKCYHKCTHCFWDSFNILCAESQEELKMVTDNTIDNIKSKQSSSFSHLMSQYLETSSSSQLPSKLDKPSWQPADADSSQIKSNRVEELIGSSGSEFKLSMSDSYYSSKQPYTSLNQRIADPSHQPTGLDQLLPLRPRLLSRKERKSILEIESGLFGNLILPKENPLEGDSCSGLTIKKGEWNKIRKMAIQFIPRITFSSLPDIKQIHQGEGFVRFKVANPQLNKIKLWLHSVDVDVFSLVKPDGVGLSEENAVILEAFDEFNNIEDDSSSKADINSMPSLVFRHGKDIVWFQFFFKENTSEVSNECLSMTFAFEFTEVNSEGNSVPNSNVRFDVKADLPMSMLSD